MTGEWPTVRLGDVVELMTGFPFKSGQYSDEALAPRLLRGDNIAQGAFRWDGAKRWPSRASGPFDAYSLRKGDVVLAMDRPWIEAGLKYAAVGEADLPALLVQRVARLRGTDRLLTRYLRYVIGGRAFTDHVLAVQTGTAVPHISGDQIRSFDFPLPSLPEQRAIAEILGAFDDKIELNRRMNKTLEAVARALFKSWFVDFDPVRARSGGRDPGLPASIATMFPDSLDDNGAGEAPDGWRTASLGDLALLNPETWTRESRPDVLRYVDLSNTKWGRIEAVTTLTAASAPSRAQRVLRPGDTIVGTVRPGNGSYAFVTEDGLTGSTAFAVLRPSRPEYAEFVYLAATDDENIQALAHLADGAAYPAVRPEVVVATRVIRPPDHVVARFAALSRPMLDTMARNEAESRVLASLRNTLVPKLISGELRVPQAERMLEAVPG